MRSIHCSCFSLGSAVLLVAVCLSGVTNGQVTEVVVCDGGRFLATCPWGTYLDFLGAWYGRNSSTICPNIASWSTNCLTSRTNDIPIRLLTRNCQGRSTCELKVNTQNMGDDPCFLTNKYLWVRYVCSSTIAPAYPNATRACQGDTINLVCDLGQVVQVRRVIYGRAISFLGADTIDLQDAATFCWTIFAWSYASLPAAATCQDTTNAFQWIEQICRGRQVCTFIVNQNSANGDPCPGIFKVMDVEWVCAVKPLILPVG